MNYFFTLILFLLPLPLQAHLLTQSISQMKIEGKNIYWNLSFHQNNFEAKFKNADSTLIKNYISSRLILSQNQKDCPLIAFQMKNDAQKESQMLETKFECVEDVMKLEISFGLFLGDPSQTHLLSVEQLSKTSSHTFSQIDSEWTLDYSKTQLFKDFVLTGIKHILNGLDHLLFILTLVFAAHSLRKLFWIITSFTLAHSFSLLWATFNWINLSPNIVEPLVALSIMVMACLSLLRTRTGQEPFEMSKNCRAEEVNTSITTNSPFRQDFHSLRRVVFAHVKRFLSYFRAKPETITFFFGIIHGLAFSEVLKETHLQGLNLIIPLLGFNSGVELAQLMIVIPFFIILSALTRHQIRLYRFVKTTLLLFCLLAAAYWFYSRIIHS